MKFTPVRLHSLTRLLILALFVGLMSLVPAQTSFAKDTKPVAKPITKPVPKPALKPTAKPIPKPVLKPAEITTLIVNAPKQVKQATPFFVKAESPSNASITFFFNGKNITANPVIQKNSTPEKPLYALEVILGVPLGHKLAPMPIVVKQKDMPAVTHNVTITHRPQQEQQLTVESKYVTPPQEVLDRIAAERVTIKEILSTFTPEAKWTKPFVRPVVGIITSQFGFRRVFNGQPRSPHTGADLRGAEGVAIKAMTDGTVIYVGNNYYSGNAVYIDHGLGVISMYCHMSQFKTEVGKNVKAGEVIGLVGKTGRVTGPHLHLSFYVLGTPLDAMAFYPQ